MASMSTPKRSGPRKARKADEKQRLSAHVARRAGLNFEKAGKADFKARLGEYARQHGSVVTEDNSLRKDHFDGWEDLEDYVMYRGKTVTVSFTERQMPRRSVPKPPRRTPPITKPASVPMSQLVRPGWYSGSPVRQIVWHPIHPEIDPAVPKFRRQRRGVGKCTGNKLEMTQRAYLGAYYVVESARREVAAMRRSEDARILWHASTLYPEASLSFWFGEDYPGRQINRMLTKIEALLQDWSLAFCAGFRNMLPVFIRCKSYNNTGDATTYARHIAKNTIELLPRFFDQSPRKRLITLLHEMGHHASASLKPRDERHDLCDGGWNPANNMCYRERDHVDLEDKLFTGGNPRNLAEVANGNTNARKAALNNIDNYVCYMWNRERDHGMNLLGLGATGAKPSRDQSKPSRGSRSKPPS